MRGRDELMRHPRRQRRAPEPMAGQHRKELLPPHTIKRFRRSQRSSWGEETQKPGGCVIWAASCEAPWSDAGERLVAVERNREAARRALARAFAEAI